MASITRTEFPSCTKVSQAPLAATATTGGIAPAPMVLYGCQMCAVSIALISAGVNAGMATDTIASLRWCDLTPTT